MSKEKPRVRFCWWCKEHNHFHDLSLRQFTEIASLKSELQHAKAELVAAIEEFRKKTHPKDQ